MAVDSVIQTLRGVGTTRLYSLVGAGVVLLAFFVVASMKFSAGVMAPLYSNLPVEDGAKIVAELDKMGIKYDLKAEGTQILVPADKVLRLRMEMAGKGMPSQGSIIGYEVFDRADSLGTPNFVYNVNLLRALEGELARTIGSFDWVAAARVHLVTPKRELFSRDKDMASASVVLSLRGSTPPTAEQVQAIRHLVASAVPQLEIGRITVVDSKGKLLSKGGESPDDPAAVAEMSDQFQTTFEQRMQKTLEALLENSLGEGKVKVRVSAEINFDKVVTNSESFNPDEQVVRSVQTSESRENSKEASPEAVTVANNLPDAKAGAGGGAENNMEKIEETTNFEISKVTKNHVRQGNQLDRVSVAVLVDGEYIKAEDGTQTYKPRSPEELAQITTLVKSAIGFDAKRGDTVEVVNLPFAQEVEYVAAEKPFEWIRRDLDSIMKTFIIGVVAIMVIILIIRPLVNRAFEIAPADMEEGRMLLGSGGMDPYGAPGGMGFGSGDDDVIDVVVATGPAAIKKVTEIATTNPDETLAVLRGWMIQKH